MPESSCWIIGSSVGKNSTVQSQSLSSCQYGSKSFLRFVPKIADPLFPGVSIQNSRYTDDTLRVRSFVFLTAIYRALRCDRCRAITT